MTSGTGSSDSRGQGTATGVRLASQGPRLRLLLAHLAGRAILARVEVEDLAQEVMLRTIVHPGGLPPEEEGEGPLWGLLSTIARNTVVDVARSLRAAKRQGREVPINHSDWSRHGVNESRISAHSPGPVTQVVLGERDRKLLHAYRALSPDHRRVLGLRQFQGLTAAEAGKRMGRSEEALHSLYRRALQAWGEEAGGAI